MANRPFPSFLIYLDDAGEYRWHYQHSGNHKIEADSGEGYKTYAAWQQSVTIYDDRYEMEWFRVYTPSDPSLSAIHDLDDPKLLGTYTFTLPSLDKATGHVEEMFETLSPLLTEIRELLPPQPAPEDEQRTEQDQP